jgi:hypothetical protein
MLNRKIAVPLKRYAHPEYLRDLCNRIERCYFSEDRDWRCIEDIFKADIKAMEQRTPKPAAAEPALEDTLRRVVLQVAERLQTLAELADRKKLSKHGYGEMDALNKVCAALAQTETKRNA